MNKLSKALKKLGYDEPEDEEVYEEEEVTPTRIVFPSSTMSTSTTTTTTTTTTAAAESGPCSEGWSHIGEGCYQVVTSQ